MFRLVKAEFTKIMSARSSWVLLGLLVAGMAALGFMDGLGVAQVGLDATPDTHPDLIEPIGPREYIGTELLSTGQAVMVILGAVLGASEYRDHQVRTTLLAVGQRSAALGAKLIASALVMIAASVIAAYACLACVQLGLGGVGLHPGGLSPTSWRLIGGAVVSWVGLGLIAEVLAILIRGAIIPIVVFVPLGLGLGEVAANAWGPASYLPMVAANGLYASPLHPSAHGISWSIGVVALWVAVMIVVSGIVFARRDIGAH